MSLWKFIAWFIAGLAGVTYLSSTLNPLMTGLIAGFVIGFLGAKD